MQGREKVIGSGSVLGGRYRIKEVIGRGGMATVYTAVDQSNGQLVALKLMRDELKDDPEFIRRFATEARAAASLDHPNIVRVLDYGQDGDVRYIIQEYVRGQNLKDVIRNVQFLSWDLAIPLMMKIASALGHAHERGIIHRDMKPQNILITDKMDAKVTDFGIAMASHANTITAAGGEAFGSVHYFSPEQARGANVTVRSDLYSLGIMLYEMLSGELPFDGETSVAIAIKQLQEMPLRPSSIQTKLPPSVDDLIFKAIQKDPDLRYQSARAFVEELRAFMHNPRGVYGVIDKRHQAWATGTTALQVNRHDSNFGKIAEIERKIRSKRRHRLRDSLLMLLMVVVVMGALATGLFYAYQYFLSDPQATEETQVEVANYVGRHIEDVRSELEAIYGDNVEWIPVRSETIEAMQIFDQDPEYGVLLKKDALRIALKYSAGQELYVLPDVRGKSEDVAKQVIADAHFSPSIRSIYSDVHPKGEVVRMEPAPGLELPAKQTILLYISQGSEESTIPPLEGLAWEQAIQRARDLNLELRGSSVSKDSKGAGVDLPPAQRFIVRQMTDAGSTVRAGSILRVEYGSYQDWEHRQRVGDGMVMPNLLFIDWNRGKQILERDWPPGDAAYTVMMQGGLSGQEHGLVVLSQSIPAGQRFDPRRQHLKLVLGLRQGAQGPPVGQPQQTMYLPPVFQPTGKYLP